MGYNEMIDFKRDHNNNNNNNKAFFYIGFKNNKH